ncbi:putative oxidoreductase [subsurface metagenome]
MLADSGVHVILTARSMDKLQKVKEEITSRGGNATVIPADIAKEQDIKTLFKIIKDKFGRLDIVINNAGIGIWGNLVDFSIEDFDKIMNINVRGTYLCCQQAMKMMIPQKNGYIINISSVVGFKGYPNQSAYTASKHAIMGLTKSLAVEAQEHNIRISAILPGGVETDLSVKARPDLDRSLLILPEDIAKTVLYLLSLSDRAMVDQIFVRRMSSSPF